MPLGFLVALLISLAISIATSLLTPRPKQPKPEAARDLDDPVAEAGKIMPLVAGTITVKGLNVLWFGDKSIKTYKVKV